MDILYLLIPLSLVLVLLIGIVLWWSAGSGQFDDLEDEGASILDEGHGATTTSASLETGKQGKFSGDSPKV